MKISSKKLPSFDTSYVYIALASLFVTLPSITLGEGGLDLIFHKVWSQNFAEQFWLGELYPRWMYAMNAGCGSPAFFFYSPLPSYVYSLFYFLHDLEPAGWYPFIVSIFLLLFVSGCTFYHWCKAHVDRTAATFGGIAYLLMPYIWLDIHFNFRFSELFTFIWAPILLHLTYQIGANKKKRSIAFAIVYALLILSSIPGTIIVSTLIAVYFFYIAEKNFWLKGALRLAGAVLLALCLAAVYLLPIPFNLMHVYFGGDAVFRDTIFNFEDAFLPNFGTVTPATAFYKMIIIAFSFLGIIVSLLIYKAIWSSKNIHVRHQALFWLIISILGVFMSQPISMPIYDLFPLLKIIRHSNRFLIIQSIAISILIVYLVSLSHKNSEERSKALWTFVAGILCLVIPFALIFTSSSRRPMDGPAISKTHENIQRYYHHNSVILHEYVPIVTDIEWMLPSKIDEFAKTCNKKLHVLSGKANTNVTQWKSRELYLEVDANTPATIQISQLAFPGWKALDLQTNKELPIRSSKGKGLINIDLGQGNHRLLVEMPLKPEEKTGWAISLLALLGIIIFRFSNTKKQKYRVLNT